MLPEGLCSTGPYPAGLLKWRFPAAGTGSIAWARPLVRLGGEADQLDRRLDLPRAPVVARVHPQGLAHAQLRLHPALLEHDPDPASPGSSFAGQKGTEYDNAQI